MRHAWAMTRPRLLLVGLMLMSVAACGGGAMTLTEYAEGAEDLVAEMEAAFMTIDTVWESQEPNAAGAEEYWDRRLEIRQAFLDGVEELRPPLEIADMHDDAVDIFSRITAADEALADRVAAMEVITSHRGWLDTPEGAATQSILAEVWEFCRASQADFDATEERIQYRDAAWLPSEMKEVVRVAFGCPE